jgi:uncharacterized lipoprotein NlpE involved in copper resistance
MTLHTRFRLAAAVAAAALLGTLGCRPAASSPSSPRPAALTGSYSGVIPCADCPGIRYTLTLLPDSVAIRRMTYFEAKDGKDATFSERRRWKLTPDGTQLVLYGATGSPERLRVGPGGRVLTMLDAEGRPIRSGLNYDLTRVDTDGKSGQR